MIPLPNTIKELHALVRQLLAENEVLKARIAELTAQVHADSHNSHKPPTSDGLRKRPALPKPLLGKKGGQPGHRGKTLKMVDHPDQTITCSPERCGCGASLRNTPGTIVERRQVFDLPEPKLRVTEYHRLRCQCPRCGQVQEGTFPAQVQAPTQYGTGVFALATLLNTAYTIPFKKIQGIFADLFGYAVNESTVVTANTTCYEALAPSQAIINSQVVASAVGHFDETGIRVAGKLYWQHVASTPSATSLFVHPHRGVSALQSEQSLFPIYHGWAVHDCWASYFAFTACHHALCGAHLLRELTALHEQGTRWAAQMHTVLMRLYRASDFGRGCVKYPQRWSTLYDVLCHRAQQEEPPPQRTHPNGKRKRTKGRNLLERLIKYKAAVLAFAFYPEVPFTNNQAERDLRPVKIKQKITGGFRTLLGAQHYARIYSFVSTTRKHGRHVFKELRNVFLGHSFLLEPVVAK